jgi:hypothetical protein
MNLFNYAISLELTVFHEFNDDVKCIKNILLQHREKLQ